MVLENNIFPVAAYVIMLKFGPSVFRPIHSLHLLKFESADLILTIYNCISITVCKTGGSQKKNNKTGWGGGGGTYEQWSNVFYLVVCPCISE